MPFTPGAKRLLQSIKTMCSIGYRNLLLTAIVLAYATCYNRISNQAFITYAATASRLAVSSRQYHSFIHVFDRHTYTQKTDGRKHHIHSERHVQTTRADDAMGEALNNYCTCNLAKLGQKFLRWVGSWYGKFMLSVYTVSYGNIVYNNLDTCYQYVNLTNGPAEKNEAGSTEDCFSLLLHIGF